MSKIIYDNNVIECEKPETVLDALIRNNISVPFSCKNGVCQTCMLRAIKGKIPGSSQKELKETLQAQNYFLACRCQPLEDIEIALPNKEEVYSPAVVISKEMLSSDICKLVLEPATPLYYHAGQFINLRRKDNLIRSYSLASLPQTDSGLELHVKRMENGKMSQWLIDDFQIGDKIDIQGPFGQCFYTTGSDETVAKEKNLILIGTGTGLAPLIGIIKDALHSKHSGEIYLYHGSRYHSGLYFMSDLINMERHYNNFHYIPCLSGKELPIDKEITFSSGRAHDVALNNHKKLSNTKIFLCGSPDMVNATKKTAYLSGAALKDIYADPFELTELRSTPR